VTDGDYVQAVTGTGSATKAKAAAAKKTPVKKAAKKTTATRKKAGEAAVKKPGVAGGKARSKTKAARK